MSPSLAQDALARAMLLIMAAGAAPVDQPGPVPEGGIAHAVLALDPFVFGRTASFSAAVTAAR